MIHLTGGMGGGANERTPLSIDAPQMALGTSPARAFISPALLEIIGGRRHPRTQAVSKPLEV